ncbi:hypothetical protein N9S62_00135 [Pelagibacteraceae bacterium]|nr:hypothetical protein [Pelagibacteraceae bacterium]
MIKNIFYLLITILILIFFLFVIQEYLSEKHIKKININRANINENLFSKSSDLPILKNDTNNIIEFNNGFNANVNNREKRSFWELLKRK